MLGVLCHGDRTQIQHHSLVTLELEANLETHSFSGFIYHLEVLRVLQAGWKSVCFLQPRSVFFTERVVVHVLKIKTCV